MVARQSNTGMQILIAFVFLPALTWAAWNKAWQFDPYTMSFFTKTYVAPYPEMPGELRIAGWVVIALAALPGYAGLKGVVKRIGRRRDSMLLVWVGCLIAGFGSAFFVAADSAQARIAERMPDRPAPMELRPGR